MFEFFHKILAKLRGKNSVATPTSVIGTQMLEPRPLPVGMGEFDAWADRLIAGSMLPADTESMKFALAGMIMHLGPTESHKPDAFFIHSLRKSAANQVAHAKLTSIREAAKLRLATEETVAAARGLVSPRILPVDPATDPIPADPATATQLASFHAEGTIAKRLRDIQ